MTKRIDMLGFRCCVNPNHLEAVTHKINVHRGDMPSIVKSRGSFAERII